MADWTIEKRQPGGGLGLGWLLAIALGGGGLVFMGVGLLLAWHINRHRQPCRTRVYARSVDDLRTLSTRLTKRRLLDSASALPTTLSSLFSLSLPPVLPPLPAYNSFNFFRAPSHRRKAAHSWTAADYDGYDYGYGGDHDYAGHWGRAWVPPDSVVADEQDQIHHGPFPGHARAKLEPAPTIAPMTLRQDQGLPRSEGTRAAAAAQAQVRPSATDTDLRDILRSTDERLRDGDRHGLSPIKTPRSSSVKHHWRGPTNPSRDMARAGRSTPSPTRRTASNTLTTQAMARDGSNVSTVSVANSLIAEATQQLCLPGGSCSPSRLTGREWAPPAATAAGGDWQSQLSSLRTPPRSPQRGSPQRSSSERPGSRESVASSTLSTLYSVGEPEEEDGEAQADEDEQRLLYHPSQQQPQTHQPRQRQQTVQQGQQAQQHGRMPSLDRDRRWPDPFSGHAPPSSAAQQAWPRKQQPCGPRPLRGSKPTMTATSACPTLQPLRPICANSLQARPESVAWPLRPPSAESSPAGKHDDATSPSLAEATSESSFQTESVHTIDSDSTQQAACETPKAEWRRSSRILSRAPPTTASPLTPSCYSAASDVLSSPSPPSSSPPSPYSEHEMLSMLLSASAPHRALPNPPAPATGSDVAALPTALTPRPRARRLSADADDPRISASSSVYSLSEPTALPASSPPPRRRRPASSRPPPGLGSTIAELRRMNSIVSSFSAASMASTAVGTDLADSPTLPSLVVAGLGLVGPMPPPRSLARAGTVGSRHYLSIGAAKPPRPALHRKSASADSPRLARGKENQGLGLAPSAIKPAAMRRPPSGLRMLVPRCARDNAGRWATVHES